MIAILVALSQVKQARELRKQSAGQDRENKKQALDLDRRRSQSQRTCIQQSDSGEAGTRQSSDYGLLRLTESESPPFQLQANSAESANFTIEQDAKLRRTINGENRIAVELQQFFSKAKKKN